MTDPHFPDTFAPLLNLTGIGPRMAERYRAEAEHCRELLHEYGPVFALENLAGHLALVDEDGSAERVFAPLARWLAGEWGT